MCVCWFGCEGAHQGTTAAAGAACSRARLAQGGPNAYTQDESLAATCSAAATARSNTAGLQIPHSSTLCLGSNTVQRAYERVPLAHLCHVGSDTSCGSKRSSSMRVGQSAAASMASTLITCGTQAGVCACVCVHAWGRAAAGSDSGCARHMQDTSALIFGVWVLQTPATGVGAHAVGKQQAAERGGATSTCTKQCSCLLSECVGPVYPSAVCYAYLAWPVGADSKVVAVGLLGPCGDAKVTHACMQQQPTPTNARESRCSTRASPHKGCSTPSGCYVPLVAMYHSLDAGVCMKKNCYRAASAGTCPGWGRMCHACSKRGAAQGTSLSRAQ